MSETDDSLRVSDAERDAVLRTLGDHAAVGRLTLDELEDRSGRALAAKTRGDLAPLTSDLPQEAGQSGAPAPAPSRRQPVRWMVAVMSASRRRGRFRAVGSINAVAVMGGNERLPRPGAPLIRIRAYNFMGGASIYRLPPQARGVGLKEAQRLAKAAERGELPAPGLSRLRHRREQPTICRCAEVAVCAVIVAARRRPRCQVCTALAAETAWPDARGVRALSPGERPPDAAAAVVRGGPDTLAKLATHARRTHDAYILDGEPLWGISVYCALDDVGPASLDGLLRRFASYRAVHLPQADQLRSAGFPLLPSFGRPHYTIRLDGDDPATLNRLLDALGPGEANKYHRREWPGRR